MKIYRSMITAATAIIICLPAVGRDATATDTLCLSRQRCVEIALQDNPSVKVADLEVKRTDYSKKEVLASLFPSIDFSGSYQRTIELQTMSMSMGGQSQKIKMGMDNMWNFGFSAAMPIILPTLWKSIQISDVQILQSLESARESRLNLVNNINKAYYSLMLALASRDVIQQNYDVAQITAEIYRKQFEQGTASEYDVLRSSVQVKNVEPELLNADISVKQCQLQLKVLMGIDSEAVIMPDITLRDMQREMFGIMAGYDRSIDSNTSLRSLDIQTELLRKNVTLKKFAYIPTLAATYNMNWNAMSNGNALKNQQFNPYSTVGVALSIPIFSGGSKYYGIKQAEVQLREIGMQRENLVNSLNMQVDLAIDNMNRQAKQIETSEEGVKQARKAHEIMQKSFDIGAASYLDLRDSELADTSAQLAYLQSIYNYLVSASELETLLGRDEALGITNKAN